MSRPDPGDRPTIPAPPDATPTADDGDEPTVVWVSDVGDTLPPDTLPDGLVECVGCGERREEDDAYEHGWRFVTQFDSEHRWQCPACARHDDPGSLL